MDLEGNGDNSGTDNRGSIDNPTNDLRVCK